MTEFAVDTSVSYSEAERRFFKGPRGKYLKSLNTWIKMLLCKKTGYATTLMFRVTRSGKTYRNEGRKGPEYSPLISPPLGDEDGVAQPSPRSAIQLIRQGFP